MISGSLRDYVHFNGDIQVFSEILSCKYLNSTYLHLFSMLAALLFCIPVIHMIRTYISSGWFFFSVSPLPEKLVSCGVLALHVSFRFL